MRFAFAGAGFLFSKLNHSGYQNEIKRHNLALEKLSAAKQKWYEKETARKNNIELKRHQLIEANADIKTTNKALAALSAALATAEAGSGIKTNSKRLLHTIKGNERISSVNDGCNWIGRWTSWT